MAELALKVGDSSTYEDGDIICAFNDRRIGCAHMQHICDHRKVPLVKGLRPIGSLAQYMKEAISEYRFERISHTEVKRVEIATAKEDTFGLSPNGTGAYIDVPLFVARRMDRDDHRIFGEPGREIWYGGDKDKSVATIDAVWAEIESRTPLRRVDHNRFPIGSEGAKVHLRIAVDDFDDVEAKRLVEPLGDATSITRTRKYNVAWRTVLGLTIKDKDDVLDPTKSVDLREQATFVRASIVTTKTL